MNLKFSKALLPTLVGMAVYRIVSKYFPETSITNRKGLPTNLRGGGSKLRLIKRLSKRILSDRALKIAILTAFTTAGIQHYQAEIEELLMYSVLRPFCNEKTKDIKDNVSVVCDILQDHDLLSQPDSVKKLIIANDLTREQKTALVKMKLDYLINGAYPGKRKFLVRILFALLLVFTLSSTAGLSIFLDALHRLWIEGKISNAVYNDILERLGQR